MTLHPKNSSSLREQLEKYLVKWKWFLASFIICFAITFLYLRYATNIYKIEATIKIADSNEKSMQREANRAYDYGLFEKDYNSVQDEIQVLRSRAIINNVVSKLNLNIQYYIQGTIKELEIYTNPPLTINFLEQDSVLTIIDTTFILNVISKSQFTFKDSVKKLNFGDNINTTVGDIILTPNFNQPEMKVGKSVKIKVSPISKVSAYYSEKIKIKTYGENSSIINLELVEPVIEKGEDILNSLIDEYNQLVVTNKNEVVKVTSDFINNRLQVVSSELSAVDLTSETIKKDNKLTDLSSQSSIFLQTERDIEAQQVATSTELQLIDYMSNYLKENSGNSKLIPANMSFRDNSINEITKKHNDLVIQRNRMLKNSSEKNPVVVNLDAQIISLKQSLNAGLENIKSSNKIKLEALDKEGSRISSQLYSAPKKERQFRDLKRQQDIKESLYLYLLQKREESAISHGVTSPNAIIVDEAYASSLPIWPKKEILFLGAFILAFLIPTSTVYILDMLDTKIRNKSDVNKELSIPFIGDVPRSNSKNVFIEKLDYSPKAEAFRLIRTNIDFMIPNTGKSKGKTIFVTSTTSKEGKSHTTINLAKSLSFSNKKVLIIETDIRVPKLNKYLGIEGEKGLGLTNFIVDNKINFADVINKVSDNLDIIPCGTIPPNPAELLMDEKLEILFNAVKNKYDYIIVDTAAVGLVTDTLLISKFADMVIYVVRANYIDKRQLHVAQSMYDEKRLPNMVVLLNAVIHKKGYGYGYGNIPKKKFKFF
jgi:tyrosine-protein kinase Etk/Wzc